MTCSEVQLVAFLAGELSTEEARRFDEHLLACEECWRSVQDDRAARLALVRLREQAPVQLADRIALLIEMAPDPLAASGRAAGARRWGRRSVRRVELSHANRSRRWVSAAVGAVGAVGLAVGLVLATGSSPQMPAQVAAVAAIAGPMSSGSVAPSERRIRVDGETMRLQFFLVDHVVVTVATARAPFPMVAPSELESGSTSRSWLATMGDMGAFCMNRGRSGESMLVLAKMPAAELPAVAVRLHLI